VKGKGRTAAQSSKNVGKLWAGSMLDQHAHHISVTSGDRKKQQLVASRHTRARAHVSEWRLRAERGVIPETWSVEEEKLEGVGVASLSRCRERSLIQIGATLYQQLHHLQVAFPRCHLLACACVRAAFSSSSG
jgi:hypothetical protein